MNIKETLNSRIVLVALVIGILAPSLIAETLYVDSQNGSDNNPGSKEKPLLTIGKAAGIVNSKTEAGPTTIKIGPGVYSFTKAVVFENNRPYTKEKRLTIEATILPDDLNWLPALMPVVISTENSRTSEMMAGVTETYSIKIKNSYATIRGLKFFGNPASNNWHNCVERIGKDLDDLLITQCMFIGDTDTADIYSAVLATGNRFVVDHCVFKNCHSSTVYWDGFEGIGGKNCAMKYCIVDGGYISGVWNCQTVEDFEFHHNIITNCEYFGMRKKTENVQKYLLHDCVITNNKYYSGYGIASGPISQTDKEIVFEEKNIIKTGNIVLDKNKKSRNYLHPIEDSLGSNLGAGLFKK